MTRKLACTLALLAGLASNFGCGVAATPASAQTARQPGFTNTSSPLHALGNGVYRLSAEALFQDDHIAGLGSYNTAFELPSNLTIVRIQGTISWANSCAGDVLTSINIDGMGVYPIILKGKNSSVNEYFDFSIPYPTGSGAAVLHMEANPGCSGDYAGMSSAEIHALIQVQ